MPGSNAAAPATGLTYTIGELAAEFGVTVRAIRFYEDKNLLEPARNGIHRVYARRDRGRLRLILRGKRLGFSLSDIREMLSLYDLNDDGREQLKVTLEKSLKRLKLLRQQRRDIDEVIGELQDSCGQINDLLEKKTGPQTTEH